MNNLLSLCLSFSKIGVVSLGGGNSMLKLIEYEAVNYRNWLLPEEFVRMAGATFLFPGLTAVKLAALIGYKTAGISGLVLSVLCINMPGILLVVFGYQLLNRYQNPVTEKIMISVQYGALALLAAACYSIAQGVLKSYFSLLPVFFTVIFFFGLAFLEISPFWGFLGFIGIVFFMV